jgi:glycyl-tRNA synthetase beta chain
MKTQDFLLELGTEELPPKLLKQLSNSLSSNLTQQLSALNLSFGGVVSFATWTSNRDVFNRRINNIF